MTTVRSRVFQTAVGLAALLAVGVGDVADVWGQAPAPGRSGRAGEPAVTATAPVAIRGTLERVKVHGKSLEGNLLGESAEPEVSIYLPPSYAADRTRRYPVVYLLHGFAGTDLRFFGGDSGPRFLPAHADRVYGSGAREMILVMPNAMNVFGGSMYSNSIATGDWEGYVADDLVAYVDQHYRTIPTRQARGLGGFSAGGYGAIRIAMKRPDVFSAIYALSSCCLNEGSIRDGAAPQFSEAETIKTLGEARARGVQNTLARAAAWSPNPANPPLYLDLPTKNGDVLPAVALKWAANSPLAMLDQYVPNLRKYAAIAIDVGLQDALVDSNRRLDEALTRYGLSHAFETYEGDHGNRFMERFEEKVLPFFSKHLSFDTPRR